nr:hypothetical protein [Anaerolineaceae bacterium]
TRCPVRQMEAYLEKLEQHGKPHSITWFEGGHGANAIDLQIEHQEEMMQFALKIIGR